MYCINVLTIYFLMCIHHAISISLNGKWKGYVVSTDIKFSAEIPGGIYSDLERAELIEKNLIGFNDVNNRWIANKSIAYTKSIEVNNTFFEAPYVVLILYGLDTFATVYINNEEVGKTSNMFLKYNFDIKQKLKLGNNELKIVFESSVKVAENLYDIQSLEYVVPPKCVPKEYNGECHVNHIRKMQASYGWDWGPAFPSMGIWKEVELQPVQNALVSEVTTDVHKKSNLWQIVITVFFETFGKKNTVIDKPTHIICKFEELFLNDSLFTNLKVRNNLAKATVILDIPDDKVQRWWPNGYGEQKLYLLDVKIIIDTDVTERKIKVGFRTVELVQDRLEKGMSFYFKINNIPIFAKGSNWIPSSVFPENLSRKETLQYLLKSSKDTHMNMLRVWGGGVYESDLFYSLADEYGIMIWQDFMFACNMYPTTKKFLDNVKEEVRQNMRRLKHHPSIVLWAGNNENEAALYGNWYGTGSAQIYKDDYVKLYVDTIKNEATIIDLTNPFVVSSPSNGLYSEEKNYTGSNPYSNIYGDVHYYNYLRDSWDINQYPVTRFASEYGFQALPSIYTIMQATKNISDLQLDSSFMKHRQHLPQGYNFMKLLISKNLEIPKSNNTIRELMDYIYLSQVTQAVSMRIQTESYRQMKSLFNEVGEGMTMGALYWQLNDVWQAPSWSSIDFSGRWKMLHYYVKDFFSPIIITSRLTKANELLLYVVSDVLKTLENLTIEIIVYEWKSAKSIHTTELTNITVKPNESRLIRQYWLDVFLERAGCGSLATAKENCMLELILKDAKSNKIAPSNYVYPYPLKKVALPDGSIKIKVKPEAVPSRLQNQTDFQIEVTAEKLALFVWLEVGNINGRFSENGFHLLQGKKNITFHTSQPIAVKDITNNLIVTSLSRIYDNNLRISDVQIVIKELNNNGA
ncbi:beta-mannosidase [Nasonia vitripennis]|uniref:beta-mannosidase n=1 Tax=Nasonia vitripennis TaxID=7425 RepID=A0A7M7QD52_NASVI|nr:beta-mannosidase [Nasonia vitripennis]